MLQCHIVQGGMECVQRWRFWYLCPGYNFVKIMIWLRIRNVAVSVMRATVWMLAQRSTLVAFHGASSLCSVIEYFLVEQLEKINLQYVRSLFKSALGCSLLQIAV